MPRHDSREEGGLFLAALLAAGMVTFGASGQARAELYSWVDGDGIIHLTNIPAKERNRAHALKPVGRLADGRTKGPAILQATSDDDAEGFGGRGPLLQTLQDGEERVLFPVDINRYDALIENAARHYRLPFAFIKAVIKVESNFNPRALSDKRARGLMQLIDETAVLMNVADPFDPEQAVFGGARYLRILANRFEGNMALVAAAYNAGPERVLRAHATIPNIPETQQYVRRVLTMYRHYRSAE